MSFERKNVEFVDSKEEAEFDDIAFLIGRNEETVFWREEIRKRIPRRDQF